MILGATVVQLPLATAVVAGAVALAVLVGVVVLTLRFRRHVARRLDSLGARLQDTFFAEAGRRGVEPRLAALEHTADEVVEEGHARRARAERLGRALDAIGQGIVVCDDTGEVVFRNHVARSFAGARHGDSLIEMHVRDLLSTTLRGEAEQRDLQLYGPPRRHLLLRGFPLDDGRRTTGAVVVIDDVSERHRVDAVRRDFVANISHELKTPVGALGLLAETLLTEDDPDVAKRLAQRMESEALRVGRIIDDLLDLSRIEAEELPRREPVPVHLVVAEAVERARPAADARRVSMVTHDVPSRLTVLADRRQLVSALFNLLENAVKYSEDGTAVEVGVTTDGSEVRVRVRDQGVGIPTRDLERIFERFYRVDRARSRETGGTGLGLAIVRHVARNHRGDVSVESREGEGSTFTLTLPAGPGPVAVTEEQAG